MKYSLVLLALLSASSLVAQTTQLSSVQPVAKKSTYQKASSVTNIPAVENVVIDNSSQQRGDNVLSENEEMIISVTGEGVSPMNTVSPAQAYALAKRAAIADAYRMIAEKVRGVRIDGQDLIKNMMVKRTSIRTSVNAMVRNANIVETTFKDGLCEVEMEIVIHGSQFYR